MSPTKDADDYARVSGACFVPRLQFADAVLEREYQQSRQPELRSRYKIIGVFIPALFAIGILAGYIFLSPHFADQSTILWLVTLAIFAAFNSVYFSDILISTRLSLSVYAIALWSFAWTALTATEQDVPFLFLVLVISMIGPIGIISIKFYNVLLAIVSLFLFCIAVHMSLSVQIDPYIPYHILLSLTAAFSLVTAYVLERSGRLSWQRRRQLDAAQRKVQASAERVAALLRNVFPPAVAARMERGESIIADTFDDATVLFADIVDFTSFSDGASSEAVVSALDALFGGFDAIIGRFGLEKIKTIGDCYMAAAGVPVPRPDHARAAVLSALEMLKAVGESPDLSRTGLMVRIGLHSGPVTAGVIGKTRFHYDLWGDTVNIASRMEAQGRAGMIHVTRAVRDALSDEFHFEGPNVTEVKGKGPMQTFFLGRTRVG